MINACSRKIASRRTSRTRTASSTPQPIGRRCASPKKFSNPYGGAITYPRGRSSSWGTRSTSFAADWYRPMVIFLSDSNNRDVFSLSSPEATYPKLGRHAKMEIATRLGTCSRNGGVYLSLRWHLARNADIGRS